MRTENEEVGGSILPDLSVDCCYLEQYFLVDKQMMFLSLENFMVFGGVQF